jgi:hypothetical protein
MKGQVGVANRKGEAKRTISFFRLVVQQGVEEHKQLVPHDWQRMLAKVQGRTLKERTYEGPTRG